MLQLKHYQGKAIQRIAAYAKQARLLTPKVAFISLTETPYKSPPDIPASIPYVCIQIPTGGGKTLVAAHSVGEIFTHYLHREVGLVLWIVPWESILSQTLAALKNKAHPYREVLESSFPAGVRVLTLKEALFGQIKPSDISDNLCVIVSTIDAFRVEDREGRKVYESNGYLMTHFENLRPAAESLLAKDENGLIIQSLENVIRLYNPLVVLDEGHNVQTPLSFDILARLVPSFVLEYSATPREHSNILVKIPAEDLKQDQMVKLPLWLSNRTTWQASLQNAKEKRDDLEKDAKAELKATGEYIRPILLIQAEPRSREDPEQITVDKILEFLLNELEIPRNEIAIKTGEKDDLAGVDLFSPQCRVRYIITVYALKEGWDCSFAYVLASVANLGQRLAVEQLIGRVLRLPGAKRKQRENLNYAYVYPYSPRFELAAQAVSQGLIKNGYAAEDLRKMPPQGEPTTLTVKRAIKDPKTVVPMLAYLENGTWELLEWHHLFEGFSLRDRDSAISFSPPEEERSALVDIEQEQVKVYEKQLPLPLIRERPLNADGLIKWLDRKILNPHIGLQDKRSFFSKVISYLLAQKGEQYLSELTRHRFYLLEVLREQIDTFIETHNHNKLLGYKGAGLIASAGEVPFYIPPDIILDRHHPGTFSKHLFDHAAPMNREEADLAIRLDDLDNLKWWYRNREREDFYLQGWWDRFYPDFLAQTKSGLTILLEYKGEQLYGAEKSDAEKELGQIWESLSEGKGRFWMVTKDNIDEVIAKVKEL